MASAEPGATGLLESLEALVREAVEGVAASDPSPLDPFRGLYVSDEQALRLARENGLGALDERLADAAARLGLDVSDRGSSRRHRWILDAPHMRCQTSFRHIWDPNSENGGSMAG